MSQQDSAPPSPVIRTLKETDESALIAAVSLWPQDEPMPFGPSWFKAEVPFTDALRRLDNESKGVDLRPNYVPSTMFFAFYGSTIAGRVSIRHYLTPDLEKVGGHIGYAVLPEFRNKGLATQLLRFGIMFAKTTLGIKSILITCSATNIASRKVIEKCGASFTRSIPDEKGGPATLNFVLHTGSHQARQLT
jgi:predicted acetyltransferase